jgi:Rhodanese-related sulfurtransferase
MNIKEVLVSGLLTTIVSCVRFFTCSSKQIQCLDVNEFETQLIMVEGEQLIDVCTPKEFEKSHIFGAKNIDFRSSVFRDEIGKLDKAKPILIYCLSGVRSKLTALICKKDGFKRIYELDAGLRGWLEAGKQVESFYS